jgi:hypothetical protein
MFVLQQAIKFAKEPTQKALLGYYWTRQLKYKKKCIAHHLLKTI